MASVNAAYFSALTSGSSCYPRVCLKPVVIVAVAIFLHFVAICDNFWPISTEAGDLC